MSHTTKHGSEKKMRDNILIVGSGRMSEYYAKCLIDNFKLNIDIYNPKREQNRKDWVANYSQIRTVDSLRKKYNFAIVACSWHKINAYILESKINANSILYEKPILTRNSELQKIKRLDFKERKNYIAFNRRFYETTRKAKKICQSINIKYARLTITDSAELFNKKNGLAEKNIFYHYQYCHYIDLLASIFGEITDIQEILQNKCFIMQHINNDVLVEILPGVSRNCSLEVALEDGTNIVMSPIEKLRITKGMTQEYSEEEKMRLWKPNEGEQTICDSKYKPGMLKMLRELIEGDGEKLCTLEEGVRIHELIGKILKENE